MASAQTRIKELQSKLTLQAKQLAGAEDERVKASEVLRGPQEILYDPGRANLSDALNSPLEKDGADPVQVEGLS